MAKLLRNKQERSTNIACTVIIITIIYNDIIMNWAVLRERKPPPRPKS